MAAARGLRSTDCRVVLTSSLSSDTAVLKAVAAGELTPSEGTAIAGLVDTYRRTLETQEFEARIVALEGKS